MTIINKEITVSFEEIEKNRPGFKKGKSGNPAGRPKGAKGKDAPCYQLLLKNSVQIIDALIDRALAGSDKCLIFCAERLIPKNVQTEANEILLPEKINKKNARAIKDEVLRKVFSGDIQSDNAERMVKILDSIIVEDVEDIMNREISSDPLEAAKEYKKLMQSSLGR